MDDQFYREVLERWKWATEWSSGERYDAGRAAAARGIALARATPRIEEA